MLVFDGMRAGAALRLFTTFGGYKIRKCKSINSDELMTKIRVAINGFGRIGRVFCRQMRLHDNLELVAINDLTNTHTLSHLLKYDSSQGHFPAPVSYTEKELIIDGKKVAVFSQENPELLPWDEMNIDVVVESTGRFTSRPDAERHLKAGARKVVISAPAQGDG
ncbi:hypothetical protein EOM75_07415, partial [Candidatus Falkowbacteria bacterium]|nr:hypothetical protein [Candidatus Falkowbacteria bacterium]